MENGKHFPEDCDQDEPCDLCLTVQEAWEEREAARGDWLYDLAKDEGSRDE